MSKNIGVRLIKPVTKVDTSVQLDPEIRVSSDWIDKDSTFQRNLGIMKSQSNILPQCIRSYKSNIAGFGMQIEYKDEYKDEEETKEMSDEWTKLSEIVEKLTFDCDTKEIFEKLIESYEIYGIAYLEVIRNNEGDVVQIENIDDTTSVYKSKKQAEYQDVKFLFHGSTEIRKKRFRKYKQTINGNTIYFKEFGDMRNMDLRSGTYSDNIPKTFRANEILEFKQGILPYGEPRWIGQVLGIDGSRRAETLNNNYFKNGRHTPLLITIQGGKLSEEGYNRLAEYMNEIQGEKGQHAFMVLEVDNANSNQVSASFGDEKENIPKVEIKDLASILQQDELFQNYLENNRKRVQSSFNLPDLYVGYTTDFNRATAQVAMEVTEEQVFIPERKRLSWSINHVLLNSYNFKYCDVTFKSPNLSNPDDIVAILNATTNAGGVTPNIAKELLYNMLGKTSEAYEEDWGDIPVVIQNKMSSIENMFSSFGPGANTNQENEPNDENDNQVTDETIESNMKELAEIIEPQVSKAVMKAEEQRDEEVLCILKQVRDCLRSNNV